ncbi:MAG: uridine kinase [Bacteriovoracaceae bacterium]|nr:uridine kinase [Bacteriovoracaceae bacterium]
MYLVGIAGGSGSGKTTFAYKITEIVANELGGEEISILSMDSYYLPTQPKSHLSETGKPNFDHPSAFDWELLRFHLESLKKGESIDVPVYNFSKSARENNQTKKVGPASVVLFEGIFSLFLKEIRDILDIKVFLHVDADMRFTRRLHRDVKERGRSLESVIAQYYETVRPMYQKYLDPQRQFADFIVGEENDNAAKILSARLKEILLPMPENKMENNKEQTLH